ncbi:alpha/beta fold hydrolase [Pseudodesulfovibrio sp. zrk46]|uniref:alpha/beta hydrolase n=1 Tax=Pseudodesulfovibrio sp. zrk46 TaxID=2725288 RepID=UPI001448BCCF|nr:alpha/beta fold hydrolase [Pseudodesulfovibrio sp. zrk46]QJB56704.1 alpha/beta hydrolase [Pseudodesulfovibrio sp. zrk46]
MTQATLIWCHGSLSQPWGDKSKALSEIAANAGLTLDAPDFQSMENPDDRVEFLVESLQDAPGPVILTGSSMGGYVAAAAAKQLDVAGLFLLAPAFYLPGYAIHVFSNLPETISVVHGWQDDVVDVDGSIRFSKQHRADLHILPDGHRLSESIPTIGTLFSHFLEKFTGQE